MAIVRRRLLCGALLALASCAHQPEPPVPKSMMLRIGMHRDEVVSLLGRPRAVELHGATEFWLYAADEPEDGTAFLPIGFVDQRVAGWGREYYEQAVRGALSADGSIPKR